MRYISAIIIMLLLVSASSCEFLRSKGIIGKRERTLASLLAQQDSIRVADSIRNIQEQLLALENAKLDSVRLADEARLAEENSSRYNIIVGSFITPEYAAGLADVYRQRGYDTKIIRMDGSRFELVAAESHKDLQQAISRLRNFQDTIVMDAWLYIKAQ
jgi:hypothetical protein